MSKFIHSLLGFECTIPAGWSELPAAWARKAKLSAAATSEKLDELLKASSDRPFLSLSMPETDPYKAVPMIQCTVKPLEVVGLRWRARQAPGCEPRPCEGGLSGF